MRRPPWHSLWPTVGTVVLIGVILGTGLVDVLTGPAPGALTERQRLQVEELLETPAAPGPHQMVALPVLPEPLHEAVHGFTLASVRARAYADPTADGAVPLVQVSGQRDQQLSPHLQLSDFAASDGADYARIDPALVDVIEALIIRSGAPVQIVSGYRHPARNMQEGINGASRSQHMAGRAADIWSPRLSPLELATLAIEEMGCGLGLGLGESTLHVDVRGYLESWTYSGAELDEDRFDRWARRECGMDLPAPSMPSPDNADSLRVAPASLEDIAAAHRDQLQAVALRHQRLGQRGAVLMELSASAPNASTSQDDYRLSFIEQGSETSVSLGLEELFNTRDDGGRYFVYVVVDAGGKMVKGIMGTQNAP